MVRAPEYALATEVAWWKPVLFGALAGGLAWGIRGQYGHETGAMIAGLLVSSTLAFLLCPGGHPVLLARAIAWGTVAMGFGGSMTYGQTVGLTHDAPLIGNWDALRWGMLGLGIKGGLWIAFCGAFLGMGLGGVRYRTREILGLMLALVPIFIAGMFLINRPFDIANKQLPLLYFSDDWYWEPEATLKPRPEVWGGFLLALVFMTAYVRAFRKDYLAGRMALWGLLGGAIGFPLGQSLQAYHAWNPEVFLSGIWKDLDPHMNWWNMMETTFGATMGATLGLGLWLNRGKIKVPVQPTEDGLASWVEWSLFGVHAFLLVASEFLSLGIFSILYDEGLILAILPMALVVRGTKWPFLVIFPLTLIPIAGKTVQNLVYEASAIGPPLGWFLYLGLPMLISLWLAYRSIVSAETGEDSGYSFLWRAVLANTWIYFLLNFAFFRYPFPWSEWTSRTPNGILFTIAAVGLTLMVYFSSKEEAPRSRAQPQPV